MNVSCLPGVRKGLWSAEEDRKLRECVEKYGEGKWHKVPHRAWLKRCRKSCRLRWLNYLSPNIKRGDFSADEVDLILRLHNLLGNRWSLIAGRLPGRTANDVKNYWNIHLKKKITYPEEARSKTEKKVREFEIIKPRPHTFSKEFPWLKTKTNKIMGYNLPKMDNVIQKQPPPTATMPPPRVAPMPPPGDRDKDGYVQDQVAWWHDMLWEMEIEMENEKTRWSFGEPSSGNSISTPGIEVAEGSSFQDTQRRDWVDNIIEENLNIWDLLGDEQVLI